MFVGRKTSSASGVPAPREVNESGWKKLELNQLPTDQLRQKSGNVTIGSGIANHSTQVPPHCPMIVADPRRRGYIDSLVSN